MLGAMKHRAIVALSSALVLASGFAVVAQDTPEAILSCIANGTKVRHTYVQHADPAKLKEAVRLLETKAPDADYPEGTIVRVIPQEAMVKRSKAAFPKSNGWEYFALAVTPQGTTVRARGDEASNRIGTCQSCHSGAAKSDYLCGGGPGCPPVPLTEEQITQLQAADPRCAK
jgi:hypothetical protein